jgi:hypothetical protein
MVGGGVLTRGSGAGPGAGSCSTSVQGGNCETVCASQVHVSLGDMVVFTRCVVCYASF